MIFCRLFSKIELSLDIQFNVEKAGKFPATHKEGGILFQALMAGNESQQWLQLGVSLNKILKITMLVDVVCVATCDTMTPELYVPWRKPYK